MRKHRELTTNAPAAAPGPLISFAEATTTHYELDDPEATDAADRMQSAIARSGVDVGGLSDSASFSEGVAIRPGPPSGYRVARLVGFSAGRLLGYPGVPLIGFRVDPISGYFAEVWG
jgi:hypothetical protein